MKLCCSSCKIKLGGVISVSVAQDKDKMIIKQINKLFFSNRNKRHTARQVVLKVSMAIIFPGWVDHDIPHPYYNLAIM